MTYSDQTFQKRRRRNEDSVDSNLEKRKVKALAEHFENGHGQPAEQAAQV